MAARKDTREAMACKRCGTEFVQEPALYPNGIESCYNCQGRSDAEIRRQERTTDIDRTINAASDKQVAFIRKLLADRDPATTGSFRLLERAAEGKLSKSEASAAIDQLLALPGKDAGEQLSADERTALVNLMNRHNGNEFLRSMVLQLEARKAFSDKQLAAIRRWTDRELTGPTGYAPARETLADGVYLVDGMVYKVKHAVHGSGNQYALRLEVTPGERGRFEYAQGAIRKITPADKMDLAKAKEFGAIYGVCCNCGATLTNEDSIEAGIGPICAGKLA